jgi:hypothetical protein
VSNSKEGRLVREHHGCACHKGDVKLREMADGIQINSDFNAVLAPRHARYLARKLYHLARKIDQRPAQAIEARSGETGTGSTEGESAVPGGDAPNPSPEIQP